MLELTVFLSGALVMVLEMVGARVLAPHVGTSAVVWTSLIGVVLACLAVGACAGGGWQTKPFAPGPGLCPCGGEALAAGLRLLPRGYRPVGNGCRGQPVCGCRAGGGVYFCPARLFSA